MFLPNVLAPITRIGAGELQVNKALATDDGGLGRRAPHRQPLRLAIATFRIATRRSCRTVRVQNYSRSPRRYDISSNVPLLRTMRSAARRESSRRPASLCRRLGSATIDVVMKIDATGLPLWSFFGGANSGQRAAMLQPWSSTAISR